MEEKIQKAVEEYTDKHFLDDAEAIEQGKHAHVRCHVESRAKLRLLESLFPDLGKEMER